MIMALVISKSNVIKELVFCIVILCFIIILGSSLMRD